MRIFSKAAFAIGPGANRENDHIQLFKTVPGAFQNMPDEYANDPTFQLALKAGDITIIEGTKVPEGLEEAPASTAANDTASQSPLEAFFEELKAKSREETLAMGEELGIRMNNNEKLGAYKKRIFEAYKLNQEDAANAEDAE